MSEAVNLPDGAFRRILCPVDFSEFSRHAIGHACAIARCYKSSVTAIHVLAIIPYSDPMAAPALVFTPEDLDNIGRELEHFVSDEAGCRAVQTKVIQGPVVNTIIQEAEALSADLIVMGTHGRGGFEHLMLGSVTERVLRRAPCPVLTVPSRAPDAVPTGPVVFRSILCATDFSAASQHGLTLAASLAKNGNARLTLMHVVEPMSVYETMALEGSAAIFEDARRAGIARLHEIAPSGVDVTEVVTLGKPHRDILQRAAEDESDLIVVGVHSGFASRFFLGSTTNHVVREASCSVLSVR